MDAPLSQTQAPGADRSAALLLLLLVLGDSAFVLLHVLNAFVLDHPSLSLTRQGGHAEWYQYLKFFWLAVLMLVLYRLYRNPGYLVWGAVFLVLLADDSFGLHEYSGALLARLVTLPTPFAMRPEHVGELLVALIVGLALAVPLIACYRRASGDFKIFAATLLVLIAGLLAFGVGVDALHSAVPASLLSGALGLLEDGGEMLMASLMLSYAIGATLSAEFTTNMHSRAIYVLSSVWRRLQGRAVKPDAAAVSVFDCVGADVKPGARTLAAPNLPRSALPQHQLLDKNGPGRV